MGFWKKTGEVSFKAAKLTGNLATIAFNHIEKTAGEIREKKAEYESKTDEELLSIAQSSGFSGHSDQEKGVARRILRERGYASSSTE